jgi:hypothetical protein
VLSEGIRGKLKAEREKLKMKKGRLKVEREKVKD